MFALLTAGTVPQLLAMRGFNAHKPWQAAVGLAAISSTVRRAGVIAVKFRVRRATTP